MPLDEFSRCDPPERPTHVRYLVLVALATAAVNAYLMRVCLAPASSTIQAGLHLSDKRMGYIHGAFYYGYVFSQLPGGWLGRRYGARLALAILSVAWAVSTLWTSVAHSFWAMLASRAAVGLAQGGLFPISAIMITLWFPASRRGTASAVPTGFMSVGSVLANGLTAKLLRWLDWRSVFQIFAAVGLAWAGLFYLWYRNRPAEHPGVNEAERKLIAAGQDTAPADGKNDGPAKVTRSTVVAMATSLSLWALCLQAIFRAFGYAFFITWFPTYLERQYRVKFDSAGVLTMLPLAGVVIGSLIGGVVVDAVLARTGRKWLSRSGVAAAALLVCMVTTFVSGWVRDPLSAVVIIAIGTLCFGLTGPTTWAATIDIGDHYTETVFAIMNMAGNIGAIACPILVGYLLDALQQTGSSLQPVLVLFTLVYLAGSLSWLVLDPNSSAVQRPRAGPALA